MSQADPSTGLEKAVLAWIETSGRALEMRVARSFRKTYEGTVLQSEPYEDVITDKGRECDVAVEYRLQTHWGELLDVTLAIECKHVSDKPWIGFAETGPRPWMDLSLWSERDDVSEDAREALTSSFKGRSPFWIDQFASHIVTGLANGERNTAEDAVRQAQSAAEGITNRRLKFGGRSPYVTFPMVVTTADMFICALNENDEVELSRTDRLSVANIGPGGFVTHVPVIREALLSQVVESLVDCLRDVSQVGASLTPPPHP